MQTHNKKPKIIIFEQRASETKMPKQKKYETKSLQKYHAVSSVSAVY